MRRFLAEIILCFLLTTILHAAQKDKILVIVNSQIYSGLQFEIGRYADDISSDYTVSLYETNGGTAQDLKDFILSQSDSLVGCVLIGNMPVFWFEIENDQAAQHPTTFPCDLFFMDLDGLWADNDNDGIYDSHTDGTGDIAPEIFIGRIDATMLSGGIEILRNYFNRDHLYWTGAFSFRKTGLAYTDIDWRYNGDVNEGIRNLYGTDNYQLINDERVSRKDYLYNRLVNDQYEFVQVALHSSPDYHWFSNLCGGVLGSNEIRNASPRALGYNLFACSACDYTKGEFLGGAYIFNNCERSLVVIGSTKTGSMLQFYAFYQPLGQNKSIGQSFVEWFDYISPYQDLQKAWHYGMTIIGDPLIKFNSGSNNHGPLVDLGCNQHILWPDSISELNANIRDDGLPAGSQLIHSWEKVDGPGNVFFDDQNALTTSGHFNAPGEYRIKLTASDGEYTAKDTKKITVSRIKWEGETSRPENGMSFGLVVRDSLAYMTSGSELIIADITNKSNPSLISFYEFEDLEYPYPHRKLAINSKYAYIASGKEGLYIIDISDPFNVHQAGRYTTHDPYECINDVKIEDNIVYVADSVMGLVILDIHDKANPKLLGNCITDGTAEAVSIQGHYAYMMDGEYGLRIFDISDKSNPRETGHYDNSYGNYYLSNDYRQNIQVVGNYAYISYQHPDKWVCISIIDVSDKTDPVELYTFNSHYPNFYVEGNYLYYMGTCDFDVFGIIDITEKNNPKLIESYKNEDIYFQGNTSLFESDHIIYLGGQYIGRGLNIFKLHLDNTVPYVYAGEDQITCSSLFSLTGRVFDDNLPEDTSQSYHWEKIDGPGTVQIINPDAINTQVFVADTGTYILRLSASDGELTGYDDVRVVNHFASGFSPNIGACENNPVPDLLVKGPNVKWYKDSLLTNLLHEGDTFSTGQTIPGAYKYYVTQTYGNCTDRIDTMVLTIKSAPNPPLSGDLAVCENQQVPDLAASGKNIRWYNDSVLATLLHTGSSFTSGKSETGNYEFFVTQTESDCESKPAKVALNIHDLPVISLGEDTVIYSDQNLILGPFTDTYTYMWNDGSENPFYEILGHDLGSGRHNIWVNVIDMNTCKNEDTLLVQVVPLTTLRVPLNSQLKIYPNPAQDQLNIELLNFAPGEIILRFFNQEGDEVYNERMKHTLSHSTFLVNISHLRAGVYFVKVDSNINHHIGKFAKLP